MALMLSRRLAAWLNLALNFNLHMAEKAWGKLHPHQDAVARFQNDYREDRLTSLAPVERRQLMQFLTCINCGNCDARCPLLYQGVNPAFPGPSQLVAAASRSFPEQTFAFEAAMNCMLCRECEAACPQRIPIAEVALHIRRTAVKIEPEIIPQRLRQALEGIAKTGNPYGISDGAAPATVCKTVLFRGCTLRCKMPAEARRLQQLLALAGHETGLIDEHCCGYLHRQLGVPGEERLREDNFRRLRDAGARTVIVACPEGYQAMKSKGSAAGFKVVFYLEMLRRLPSRSIDTSKLALFAGCRLERSDSPLSATRELLAELGITPAITVWEKGLAPCCGVGGLLPFTQPEAAGLAARAVLDQAGQSGARRLLTVCPTSRYWLGKQRQPHHPEITSLTDLLYDAHFPASGAA